ncbi:MAG: cell division protein ZapA [Bacillota bacterium]
MNENKETNNKTQKNNCNGKAKVKILGEYYVIKSDGTEEYINNIASFVDHHLSKIKSNCCAMPRNRLFLLGLMNLADDLYENQNKVEQLEKKVNELKRENRKLKNSNNELTEKHKELKTDYQEMEEEYNEFLDLVEEKGGLD